MVGCTGEMQTRMPGGDAFNFCDASAVADIILRVCFRPAIGLGEYWLSVDTHDGGQFFARDLNQGSVILLRQKFCAGSADEDTNQFAIFGRAMRKLL